MDFRATLSTDLSGTEAENGSGGPKGRTRITKPPSPRLKFPDKWHWRFL